MTCRKTEFRGKPVSDVYADYTGECLFSTEEYAIGNLIVSGDECYIVGGVVDVDDEYLALEWWVKVRPETVEQIEMGVGDNE